jgi:ubiquinone/menaquinone biosynthesis C-methylase UbiE
MTMPGSDAPSSHDIPRLYDRHLGPFLFEPYAHDIAVRAARLAPTRLLEIGCGTGIATAALRHGLEPDAELVATDVDTGMLEVARRKLGDVNIRWEIADGAELPFEAAAFEVVVCQFGYMFFRDKVAAFREARRVLTTTGTLLFSVWGSLDENPYGMVVHQTLAEAFETDPRRLFNAPFGYHDESRLRADLAAAGFADVHVDEVRLTGEASSAAEVAAGSVFGSPTCRAIAERRKDHRAIESELSRRLARLGGEAPFSTSLVARVISAWS